VQTYDEKPKRRLWEMLRWQQISNELKRNRRSGEAFLSFPAALLAPFTHYSLIARSQALRRSGNGRTCSVYCDLPIAPGTGRNQPHHLASLAGFQ
jgi:hypothetical protein